MDPAFVDHVCTSCPNSIAVITIPGGYCNVACRPGVGSIATLSSALQSCPEGKTLPEVVL
jgi:hypothetical protein